MEKEHCPNCGILLSTRECDSVMARPEVDSETDRNAALISDYEIGLLRDAALSHGDLVTVEFCALALLGDRVSRERCYQTLCDAATLCNEGVSI